MPEIVNAIVGLGEVGSALKRIIEEHPFEEDRKVLGIEVGMTLPKTPVLHSLHICIPYSPNFMEIVMEYKNQLKPRAVIIHSTVPVGTTKKIEGAFHSPVRGKHPHLYEGLKKYVKYVGWNKNGKWAWEETAFMQNHFKVKYIENTDITEFMKLASLAKYCAYIGVAKEIDDVCSKIEIDYEYIKDWDRTQNEHIDEFYKDMKWPVLNSPKGTPKGHCVMPVAGMFVENYGNIAPIISEAYKKY